MAKDMSFLIKARDATKGAFTSAENNAHGLKKALHGIGTVAGGIGVAALGTKLLDFGKESIDAFGVAAASAGSLQRQIGGTVEDASRLQAAFSMSGVGSDVAAKAMKGLSVQLSNANGQLGAYESAQAAALAHHKNFNGTLGASAAAFARMGVSIRDSSGGTADMKTTLLNLADQFKSMPAGADKTALAVKLFGKAGLAMLPFLNKGKAGVEELMKSSDALGTTLSGKDVAAAKANTMAKREMNHAIEGLQIAVGRQLYPTLTAFTKLMTDKVVPVVREGIQWMQENKKTVAILAGVIGGLIIAHKAMSVATTLWKDATLVWQGVQKVATAMQWAFNAALDANPIGLVVIAIALFIGGLVLLFNKNKAFHDLVLKVWAAVKGAVGGVVTWFVNTALPWLSSAFGAIAKVVVGLWHTFSDAFGKVQGVVGNTVQWVKDKFHGLLDFFSGLGASISGIFSGVWSGIVTTFKTVWNHLADLWNGGANIANHIPGVSLPQIPHLAKGGIVNRPTIALIGEAGPEAVVPLGKGGIGGGNVVVNITVAGDTDPVNAARRIGAILDKGIASGAWRPVRLATR